MQPAIPLVGGLPLLGALPRFVRDPFAVLRKAAATSEVCRLDLGFLDAVTLHNPEHVDHVLVKQSRVYAKEGAYWESIRGLVGNGLIGSRGSFWLRQRRMMQPQFHRRRLEAMTDNIVEAIDHALAWDEIDDSWQTFEVGGRMPRLTMNVVSSVLLGSNTTSAVANEVFVEMRYVIDHMLRTTILDQVPRWIPMPGRQRFRQAVERVRHRVAGFVEARRQAAGGGDDLLGMMLEARDEETGQGMSDEQLLDETLNLYVAGFETTANGLQWALYFLARHPEHFGRLREETDAVLGHRRPTFADVPRLSYARWVMQEALRINPPAWWQPRMATHDDEIDGYAIAEGTTVAPVIYTIHRHPDFWPDPECFDPERFSPARSAGRHRFAWAPFGAGPHQCIGRELAMMEATLALAMLAQRYELAWSGDVATPRMSTVIVPDRTVRARVRLRRGVAHTLSTATESSSSIAL